MRSTASMGAGPADRRWAETVKRGNFFGTRRGGRGSTYRTPRRGRAEFFLSFTTRLVKIRLIHEPLPFESTRWIDVSAGSSEAHMNIPGFEGTTFRHGGIQHDLFRRGEGRGVIIMHELPGMSPGCIRLAERIFAAGFRVLRSTVR
jgi:hypothetical protein